MKLSCRICVIDDFYEVCGNIHHCVSRIVTIVCYIMTYSCTCVLCMVLPINTRTGSGTYLFNFVKVVGVLLNCLYTYAQYVV